MTANSWGCLHPCACSCIEDVVAERDALAAKLEAVRQAIARHSFKGFAPDGAERFVVQAPLLAIIDAKQEG